MSETRARLRFGLTPLQAFLIFAALHVAVWTLLPALLCANAPLDVIEGFAWGREWLIGTYKHPPLQAWVLEIFARLFQRAGWAPFLASQLCIAIAFWAVWDMGRRMLRDDRAALIAVLLLEGVLYYGFTAPEFNPNVLQLPLWALMARSFYRATRADRWTDWGLLGLWSALGLYAKYSSGLLLIAFALFAASNRQARACLTRPGPWLAAGLCALLIAPHAAWVIAHDYQPFVYAASRSETGSDWWGHILYPLWFAGAQGLDLLGAGLVCLALWQRGVMRPALALSADEAFNRHFLRVVMAVPFVFVLLVAATTGGRARDMWGTPFWNFIGVLALLEGWPWIAPALSKRFWMTWCGVACLWPALFILSNTVGPAVTGVPLRTHFPGRALAAQIETLWREQTGRPLPIIVGDTWLAGNVAYYAGASAAARPHVYILADPSISPWLDDATVRAQGAVFVWCGPKCRDPEEARYMPLYLKEKFPGAVVQKPLTFSWQSSVALPPAVFGWAILAPAPS